MFLSHPDWVASIELFPVSPSLLIIDGSVSASFDFLFSGEGFFRIGSLSLPSPTTPTHWLSACRIDNKPIRPIQCRINEKNEIEVFLNFKYFRSITVFFDSVMIDIGQPTTQSVTYNSLGPIVKLSGTIPAPVFWDSPNHHYFEVDIKLPQNIRPKKDLFVPILSSSIWFVCKIFADGRVIVEFAHSNVSLPSDTPVPLSSVWWLPGDTGEPVSPDFAVAKIDLINSSREQLITPPGKPVICFALNRIESSELDVNVPGVPRNLVQLLISSNGVEASENVMINTNIVYRIGTPKKVIDPSNWLSAWQSTLSVSDFAAISKSVGEGIEQYANGLCDRASGRLNVAQLRSMLIDKKINSVKRADEPDNTCAWLRARVRPLAPGQLGMISDHIVLTVCESWGLDLVLEKVKKFLSSKVEDMEFELSDNVVLSPTIRDESLVPDNNRDVYRPPPPLGGWMISGRKCAHQIRLAKNALPDELDTLYRIINWFHQWSTSDSELTHSSFLGNQDVFTNTGKWKIPDDPNVQKILFKHMAWIYKRGYDTFISEIQTPVFPLIEDIDCESTIPMSDTTLIDEIFLSDRFIAERARALKIIYPNISQFKCYIYSSSGFNKSKGRWKSSFHLVWPNLVVDGRLAPIIRQTAVEYFLYKTNACTFFKRMQYRLANHYDANIWENVFDQTTSNCMNGLRMPYSNKASWVKTSGSNTIKYPKVEDRHCFPRGTVVVKFKPTMEDDGSSDRAMERLIEAEKLAGSVPMQDQNTIINDRTQYKSIDKNTINRTSAFFKAMKVIGGDTVADLQVSVEWTETVHDANNLPDEDIEVWIKRGSCRLGGPHESQLTPFNEVFVEEFETADLDIFEGHTLDSLRRTDIWEKMTPAAQAGIKTRFRKYLLRKSATKNDGTTDTKVKVENEQVSTSETEEEEEGEEELPPPVDDEEERFEEIAADLQYVRKYTGTVIDFERQLKSALKCSNSEGYWIHTQTSVSWTSERERTSNGWGSFLDVYDKRSTIQSVKVSYYYNCGKIVIAENQASKVYMLILKAVKSFSDADDHVYHKLNLPHLSEESFPLLDEDELLAQRDEYEKRWLCMKNVD